MFPDVSGHHELLTFCPVQALVWPYGMAREGRGARMNIGRAAELSGVPSKTIRYYESVGLLPPTGRAANGYRDFSDQDVAILRFISRGRGLGFSVEQVSELLSLYRDRDRTCSDVRRIAISRIADIDRKMRELGSIREVLDVLAQQCAGDQRPDCPILADLAESVGAAAKA